MREYSNRNRPFHLGDYALERLTRTETADLASAAVAQPDDVNAGATDSVAAVCDDYRDLFRPHLDGPMQPRGAGIPDDPQARADNLKASAYFLNADLAGAVALDAGDWLDGGIDGHTHALVFAVRFGREPADGEPGDLWIRGSNVARTDMRATELAAVLSGYLRRMGFPARGHAAGDTMVDLPRLALKAGICLRTDGKLAAPFLNRGFRLAAVTCDYALAPDLPLDPAVGDGWGDPDVFAGIDGTRPGRADAEEAERALHMGRYPMETIRRVEEPTTLVLPDEITRVPKRGDFFTRALAGDLGAKAQQERRRFPMKHPFALGMRPLVLDMVPLQGTREKLEPTGRGGDLSDPERNAQAIKALGYYLGADFVGICKAEPYMYYATDDATGAPIAAYHDYAVVMLIDQGFETMEGASGDDWISASQSFRAYMRGAEMAGIMAAHCRTLGYSSRAHSNAHSEVVHNPAILMAGLGEVSRIGDTILNPFIGPRSKSVVFTTDLPLAVDKPIDFGLQDFCAQCRKCARECPCIAIPFGPKIMFNGYEIWKADVEKCTKYRVTQTKGSACGRCMKMCPWNREDTVAARHLMEQSIHDPDARAGIIAADDAEGNGTRNPVKRWWFDLEDVDGTVGPPRAGINERDLSLGRSEKLAAGQKVAIYPPELQPAPGTTVDETVPIDRPGGLAAQERAETPAAARARVKDRAT